MRIMVFDVPAVSGGALTILNQYYDMAVKDKKNEWIFIVSTPKLEETEKVKVLNYPWIKKSWVHRLYFDKFVANKIADKYRVDEILSLQNVVIPKVKVKQILYLHQPLPFVEKRYSITENFKFWVYQNIIGKMIFKSIRKADKVIVQTKWIRDAAMEKANVKEEKFILKQPELNISVKKYYESDDEKDKLFLYPAGSMVYKNHEVIVNACKLLKDNNICNYRVVFTLYGNENTHIKMLKQIVIDEKLPIDFIGSADIETVYDFYSKSILIFASYIETFGLPLLEARLHNCPIIAADTPFAKEILQDYTKSYFFRFDNAQELSGLIKKIIE